MLPEEPITFELETKEPTVMVAGVKPESVVAAYYATVFPALLTSPVYIEVMGHVDLGLTKF